MRVLNKNWCFVSFPLQSPTTAGRKHCFPLRFAGYLSELASVLPWCWRLSLMTWIDHSSELSRGDIQPGQLWFLYNFPINASDNMSSGEEKGKEKSWNNKDQASDPVSSSCYGAVATDLIAVLMTWHSPPCVPKVTNLIRKHCLRCHYTPFITTAEQWSARQDCCPSVLLIGQ